MSEEVKAKAPARTAQDENYLVPTKTYLKSGIHIGTKFRTKQMAPFIYKTRADGLSILNLKKIDERLKIASRLLGQYAPEEILVASRRENGWKVAQLFGNCLGCKVFAGRYSPGLLTNLELVNFMEVKLILVTDPWPDRNIIRDASKVGIPIMGLCDTNNQINNIDLVVPCNNKGRKSLGLIFWILAREYFKARGEIKKDEDFKEPIENFIEE
jgi:small subunit ribosomal protein S2